MNPYLLAIKYGAPMLLALAIVGGIYYVGYRKGSAAGQESLTKTQAELLTASRDLSECQAWMNGASAAISEANERADEAEAEAQAQVQLAQQAAQAAVHQRQRTQTQMRAIEKQLAEARKRPGCQTLLDTDLAEACGL